MLELRTCIDVRLYDCILDQYSYTWYQSQTYHRFPQFFFPTKSDLGSIIETRHQRQVREAQESAMADEELTNAEMFRQLKGLLATAETKQDLRADKMDARFDNLTNEINAWRPQLEGRVDAFQTAVAALQRQVMTTSSGASGPPAPDMAAVQAADARALAGKSLLGAPPAGTDPLPG